TTVLDAVARSAIGVIQRRRADADSAAQIEAVADTEVLKLQYRLHCLERHGKRGLHHLTRQNLLNPTMVLQVTRKDLEGAVLLESRREEGKAVDVIPVRVSQKQARAFDVALEKLVTERTYAGARVEDQRLIPSDHFQTAGIAPIAHVLRRGAGNATPHATEH